MRVKENLHSKQDLGVSDLSGICINGQIGIITKVMGYKWLRNLYEKQDENLKRLIGDACDTNISRAAYRP